jgi:hypothetical protein
LHTGNWMLKDKDFAAIGHVAEQHWSCFGLHWRYVRNRLRM